MAGFSIYSLPATQSYTDGIPFISVKIGVGVNNQTSQTRHFEATRLDQIEAECEIQKKMIAEPSVIMVRKTSGRAPKGFNDWNNQTLYFDPAEQPAA